MTQDTDAAQQLKTIEKEIAKLQKQAKTLQTKQRIPILNSIIKSMREYDITPNEIIAALEKKSKKPALLRKNTTTQPKSKRPVPPKYRHPDTGEQWTGRGKTPRWIVTAEAAGKLRNDFLIIHEAYPTQANNN